jgi:hypothetical protein
MTKQEKYKFVFSLAEEYLKNLVKDKLPAGRLDKYLYIDKNFKTMNDVTKRLCKSLRNRYNMPKIIRLDMVEDVLFNFDCYKILESYDQKTLFNAFSKKVNIGDSADTWGKYSKYVISGCRFLSSFKNSEEFEKFVSLFSYNKYTKAALPMLLAEEIDGFGFALACDFLKEIGYTEYPKPDRHLNIIFSELGLAEKKDYEVYKAIIEMSETVNKTAYYVDKVFWLISSGNFYEDREEDKIDIQRNRDNFIKYVQDKIKLV